MRKEGLLTPYSYRANITIQDLLDFRKNISKIILKILPSSPLAAYILVQAAIQRMQNKERNA
jgi:hypothetical protein